MDDSIASEVPVALTYNRVSHVVMMATPADLEEFALGFSITEGLIGSRDDLLGIRVIPREGGIELAMTITEDWFDRLATQRRNMVGRTGCGLCGAENIEQALRQPAVVGTNFVVCLHVFAELYQVVMAFVVPRPRLKLIDERLQLPQGRLVQLVQVGKQGRQVRGQQVSHCRHGGPLEE